jgi:nitrite reductase/ring-hydroxylating ferredoxin subunit
MAQDETKPTGPDLSQGIPLDQLADGKMLIGHVGGEDVLLVRRGHDVFAVGAHCAHYHGPLVDGLVVGAYGAVSVASRLFRSAHWRFRSASAEPLRAGRSSSATERFG